MLDGRASIHRALLQHPLGAELVLAEAILLLRGIPQEELPPATVVGCGSRAPGQPPYEIRGKKLAYRRLWLFIGTQAFRAGRERPGHAGCCSLRCSDPKACPWQCRFRFGSLDRALSGSWPIISVYPWPRAEKRLATKWMMGEKGNSAR